MFPDAASKAWHRTFLKEKSSLGLSLFRPFVAFTAAAHVLPTFWHLEDNYLRDAFKIKNPSFFTLDFLRLVDASPDWLVKDFAVVFVAACAFFFLGLFTQTACILMVAAIYTFYAMNSLHIGTLSFDILLVTLFLMCVTGYAGDHLSLDALRHGQRFINDRKRPFFIQRLLQLQIASTFLYTGLCKFTAGGNWFRDNPIYYLLNSAPGSVVKEFPLREFFGKEPSWCYAIGLGILSFELSMSFLIFWRRTRLWIVALGILFHVMLLVTLHVPTIFFFLFPPQLLLFVSPEKWKRTFKVCPSPKTSPP